MNRVALLMGLVLVSGGARAADEIEPLDGAFLEYLANLEGDDDDWTLLADADRGRDTPSQADDAKAKEANKAPQEAKPSPDER